jgi:hypothetical protein
MLLPALSSAQLAGHALSAGGSGHYSHSVIRHSSDFLLVNLRGSD